MFLDDAELNRLRKIVSPSVFDAAVYVVRARKKDWQEQSMDTRLISDGFLADLYHNSFDHPTPPPDKDGNNVDVPGITVESRIQSTLIKSSNALHVCSRCLKNGISDEAARDITVHNKYRRGDEPMISSMRCNTCGFTWVNTN